MTAANSPAPPDQAQAREAAERIVREATGKETHPRSILLLLISRALLAKLKERTDD